MARQQFRSTLEPRVGAGIWARQFCRNRRRRRRAGREVKKQAKLFEQAARWYRLDLARLDRTAPSELRRKLDQIAKSGRRLLKNLGILDLNEAVDGPGDPEIFDALTLLGEGNSPIVERTRQIADWSRSWKPSQPRLNWDVAQNRRLPRPIKSERCW